MKLVFFSVFVMVAISHIYSFNLGSVRKLSHLNKKIGLLLSTPPKHSSEATSSEVKPKNWWEEMILAILEALPLAMRTPSPEMDPSKVIHNPPSFIKPGTASSFRRAHHTESAWKTQDVIDAFNAKYGVGVPIEAIATSGASAHSQPAGQSKAALVELLDELDEMELIQSVDKQLSPALRAGKFVADSAGAAFAKLEEPDPTRMKPNPKRFVAPMNLHEIKKKLREDPDYYDK